MEISRLWAAMLTRNQSSAGTDSKVALTVNINGVDRVNHTFPDTTQLDQETAEANLYAIDLEGLGIEPSELTDSSIRLGIRGSDAWRPLHFFVWGQRLSPILGSEVIPLGIETSISTQVSADPAEGVQSIPIRLVTKGSRNMPINRIFLLLTTAGVPDDGDIIAEGLGPEGTNSAIEIQIVSQGRLVVLTEIRDTSQSDAELGSANFYSAPVISPFTRASLDAGSITLRLKGRDNWTPASVFVFGLDDAAGRPEAIVPLVHIPSWNFGAMEADPTNGMATVTLPLVADASFPGDSEVVVALKTLAARQDRILEILEKTAKSA
jgi:hypothetical protein